MSADETVVVNNLNNLLTNEEMYGTHETTEVKKPETLTQIPEEAIKKYVSPYSLKALAKPKPKKIVKKVTEQSVINFTSKAVAERYLTSDTK